MPRYKVIVQQVDAHQAQLMFEDGMRLAFPISKLPKDVKEGTFLTLSLSVDRLASLLISSAKPNLFPRGAKP